MGRSLSSSAGSFMLSSTRWLCFCIWIRDQSFHFDLNLFPMWPTETRSAEKIVLFFLLSLWESLRRISGNSQPCAVLFCSGGKKRTSLSFSISPARLAARCRVYAASFYRTMMSVYYKLPFAKGQTVLDVKIGDSEVISHQRKRLSAADSRLFCLSPVWWGGVPCCISGIVTCWPVCRHQVTLPSDFSPVRRWTLDFRNVSASFHHVVVPLPHCSASDDVLMLQLYLFYVCVYMKE